MSELVSVVLLFVFGAAAQVAVRGGDFLASARSILTTTTTASVITFADAQYMSFSPSISLNKNALAFSQSALIGDERVLFGGITVIKNKTVMTTDDPQSYFCLNASKTSVGINANPAANTDLDWNPFEFALPMPLSGVFSTQYDNTLYITPMGTQMDWGTECDDCVWYAKLDSNTPRGKGIQWIPIPFDRKRFRPRRKAGLSASGTKLRLFGGVAQGTYEAIREVLTYCLISKQWYIEAKFSTECTKASQLSSCAVFYISDAEYMLSCVASNMRSLMIATWHPETNDTLTTANIFQLDSPLVGGLSVTQIGQYLVAFGQRIGSWGTFAGGCSPYVLTVDMTTGRTYPMAAEDVSCRFGVTVFSNGPALYLAGGIEPAEMKLTGIVETASFGPRLSYVVRNGQRNFKVGEIVGIHTQPCGPGTVLRFANSPTCQSPVPGTSDTACVPASPNDYSAGYVVFKMTEPVKSAYLCVSFGSCQVPRANRTACRFAASTTDFYSCTLAGCCYDSSNLYYGRDRCYAYVPVEAASVDHTDPDANNRTSRTRYFSLVAPTVPFTVTAVDPDEEGESFFHSTKGKIIVGSAGAGAFLILVGALIAVMRLRSKIAAEAALNGADDVESQATADEEKGEFYGKYKILKKLGQGGFGSVFLVERVTDKKQLALKHIVCKDEEERNYAVTEFEILYAAQGHENMINLEEMIITWEHRSATNSSGDNSTPSSGGGGEGGSLNANALATGSGGAAPIRSFTDKNKKSSGSGNNTGSNSKGSGKSNSKKGELAPLLLQVAPKAVCIVMDYCPDGDLSAYVSKVYQLTGRALPEHLLLRVIADQVCSLLMHLQSRHPPICHRDLKPENILLKDNATKVIVTDFGLAQSLEKSFMSTRAGTLHYMAPECWKRHYTATVDMWALGCILYACATVRVEPQVRRVMFHDAKRPNFRQEISFDLREFSDLFRTIVLGLLVVDPAKRLTAAQVLHLLNEN